MKKAPVKMGWDLRNQLTLMKAEINKEVGFSYLKDQEAVIRLLVEKCWKERRKEILEGLKQEKEVFKK
jgi:argonaute-like protein implicated in RNA metabolism and viral defense